MNGNTDIKYSLTSSCLHGDCMLGKPTVICFLSTLSVGSVGIATSTRLLAMWRTAMRGVSVAWPVHTEWQKYKKEAWRSKGRKHKYSDQASLAIQRLPQLESRGGGLPWAL